MKKCCRELLESPGLQKTTGTIVCDICSTRWKRESPKDQWVNYNELLASAVKEGG